MTIDDGLGRVITGESGLAFWRAFILEDRETREITGRYRFKYPNGEKTWTEIAPKIQDREQAFEKIRFTLELVMNTVMKWLHLSYKIECFYPPDDKGDPLKTITWLEEKDLVEVTRVDLPNSV